MSDVPLEEADPAKKAFGDLTEGEREAVRDALAGPPMRGVPVTDAGRSGRFTPGTR